MKRWIDTLGFTSKVCFCSCMLCIVVFSVTSPLWVWFSSVDKLFATMITLTVGSMDLGILFGVFKISLERYSNKRNKRWRYTDAGS